ncbi:MAG: putative protein N(5)-glutamine methyltransferase [Marmoricola sp.]
MPEPASHDDVVTALRAAGCVYAEEEAAHLIEAAGPGGDLATLVQRRVDGEPLEWIVGWAWFGDSELRIGVRPGVFVPRRQTALVAEIAFDLLPRRHGPGTIVDLCCGTGAIAFQLQDYVPSEQFYLVDIDPEAVACARENVEEFHVDGFPDPIVLQGDLFDALPDDLRGNVDMITANTPYVPTEEIRLLPAEARAHEPLHTLDGGPDGLALLRRIALGAKDWLVVGGGLVIEISDRQIEQAVAAFEDGGLVSWWVRATDDEGDYIGTLVAGRYVRPESFERYLARKDEIDPSQRDLWK